MYKRQGEDRNVLFLHLAKCRNAYLAQGAWRSNPRGGTHPRVDELIATPPIAGYRVPAGCCDELLEDDGRPRPHAAPLMATLTRLGPEALAAAGHRRDTIFMQQGITFEVAGTDGERRDRAWPLDLVPRVLPADEWTGSNAGWLSASAR